MSNDYNAHHVDDLDPYDDTDSSPVLSPELHPLWFSDRLRRNDDGDFDEEEEDDDGEDEEGAMEYTCCVCMVKRKGAAFIPCGHTFCRMCLRELNVRRGNCPLCNN